MRQLSTLNNEYLPKCEILFYFAIYTCSLGYGIYQVYILNTVSITSDEYSRLDDGWKFLNRKRDNLNYEWEIWKTFFYQYYMWFILHSFSTELVKGLKLKIIPYIHASITILFIIYNYNIAALFLFLIQIAIFSLIILFKKKRYIWAYVALLLVLINICKTDIVQTIIYNYSNLDEWELNGIVIIFAWNLLKCVCFSLDSIKANPNTKHKFSVSNMYGYILYFPTLLIGPFMIYERYSAMLERNHYPVTDNNLHLRLIVLVKNLGKALFWMLFIDFFLHFVYLNHFQNKNNIIEEMNPWALYAFGYMMGQLFCNKYIVCYGVGTSFAQFDGIKTPQLPKCIGRIHQYSDMWKYFDQGLYEFLFLYVYAPICTKPTSYKILASFSTFLFIYLWHGFYSFVLIWSLLNFIFLQVELLGKHIERTYRNNIENAVGINNKYRLNAIFGAQLFIPAALSNFYFIGGMNIGNIFMMRTYLSGDIISYMLLSFSCYCIYHTSEFVKRLELKNKCIREKYL